MFFNICFLIKYHWKENINVYRYMLNDIVNKGMNRSKLDVLIQKCNLTDIESSILIMYYVERKSITYIAYKLSYSYDRIWQLKKIALNKIISHTKDN